VKLALHGASGRMGQAVVRIVCAGGADAIVGATAAPGIPEQGRDVGELSGVGNLGVVIGDDVASGLLGAEVVIDFSLPKAVQALARAAARARIPIVSGTTGLGDAEKAALDEAARVVPVLWAANMSVGIEVLAQLARTAAKLLGDGYDVEIVETHHAAKVDAPSGTALRLVEAVRQGKEGLATRFGREGAAGPRPPKEIGVLAVRGGDVIGDHTIHLLGRGERIELTHRATQRDMLARGAVRAARWLAGKPAGRYVLADTLH
jgi:4-hydroxy-tetrahydrodipicolinate reductase